MKSSHLDGHKLSRLIFDPSIIYNYNNCAVGLIHSHSTVPIDTCHKLCYMIKFRHCLGVAHTKF